MQNEIMLNNSQTICEFVLKLYNKEMKLLSSKPCQHIRTNF